MIKCNLSVILAERGLKIGDVHEATGISRNTLSTFYNNKATGIQYDTLNKLCEYLDVLPGDILKHIVFKIELLNEISLNVYKARIKLNKEVIETDIRFQIEFDGNKVSIDVEIPKEVFTKLSIIPKKDVEEEIIEKIGNALYKQSDDSEKIAGKKLLDSPVSLEVNLLVKR